MNLMQSLLFLKACSSEGGGEASISPPNAGTQRRLRGCPGGSVELHTCVHRLLDGDEAHGQRVLDVDQLHVHEDVAQVALQGDR